MEENKVDAIKELGENLKILYVEDNDDAREQSIKMFENFFSNIEVAIDGEDGLNQYKNQNDDEFENGFDLVITDINMPKLDGIDMCKEILDINPSQHILVISAYNESEKLQKLIDLGISQYIHKPIELEELVESFYKIITSISEENKKEEDLAEIKSLNHELDALVNSFDRHVIASRTDLKGNITYASDAYEIISGYTKDELIGQPHNIVRHPDMPSSAFKEMWDTIQKEEVWKGDVKNLRKNGGYYWVRAVVGPYYDSKGNHIGYSAIREDITSQKEVEELHQKVNDLLNNAGQGFLSFNSDMVIESGYSKECLKIFKTKTIENQNIVELLFKDEEVKQELFIEGINKIIQSDNDFSKELLLSLIPSEQTINKKVIKIDYKLLDNNRFMAILTDVTSTSKLEEKLKTQIQNQNMIVAVASNKNEFLEIKFDFENFLNEPPKETTLLLRELHTYKGIFSQKHMVNSVKGVHKLESQIKKLLRSYDYKDENLKALFDEYDMYSIFKKDLDIIAKALGKHFLEASCTINIDNRTIDTLETKINYILNEESKDIYNKIEDVLDDIQKLKHQPLKEMLNAYGAYVKSTATKHEKYINPLIVEGDEHITVSPEYKSFFKSLVHLFNNCIDHGIEDADTRVESGKDEMGTITCRFEKTTSSLTLEVEDDGSGIDIDKLAKAHVKKGKITQQEIDNISDEDKVYLVFEDGLSSKDSTTTTSGMGVGMSSIKGNVDDLKGDIYIENNPSKGVKFKFVFPIEQKKDNSNKFHYRVLNSIMDQLKLYLNDHSDFKVLSEDVVNSYELYEDCSIIKLTGDYKGQVIFNFPKGVINSIVKYLIPEGFSEEETQDMMIEIPHEIANIVAGLAISGFPLGYKDTDISPPFVCHKEKLELDIQWASHCIIKQIKTSAGNINCILVQE